MLRGICAILELSGWLRPTCGKPLQYWNNAFACSILSRTPLRTHDAHSGNAMVHRQFTFIEHLHRRRSTTVFQDVSSRGQAAIRLEAIALRLEVEAKRYPSRVHRSKGCLALGTGRLLGAEGPRKGPATPPRSVSWITQSHNSKTELNMGQLKTVQLSSGRLCHQAIFIDGIFN